MKEVGCYICGLLYEDFPLDMTIPDEYWEQISPTKNSGGLLCAGCIVSELGKLDLKEPVPAIIWTGGLLVHKQVDWMKHMIKLQNKYHKETFDED